MIPQDVYPAIIPFLTCGWPSPDAFVASAVGAAEAGCPFFEVGFPFSDPIADGPTIQETSAEALANGIDLEACFELTQRAATESGLPAVVMTYANLVYFQGLDAFCRRAAEAGAVGLIVPDLSFEESEPLKRACVTHGLHLVSFLAPTTATERRFTVARAAEGFMYLVAVRGVTGGASVTDHDLRQLIADAKTKASCPVLVGFGVREAKQVAEILECGADGAIVGSAILEAVRASSGDPEDVKAVVKAFLSPLVGVCSRQTEAIPKC